MAQVLKDEVKIKIKESAVDEFTQKGFKRASIKEIAEKASVSVGNVYRYFPNKNALYEAVIKGVYDGVNDILKIVEDKHQYKNVLQSPMDHDQLFEPMVHFIKLYRNEKAVFKMLLQNGRDRHYNQTIHLFIDLLKQYFMRFWREDQGIGGMTEIEASAFTNAIVFSVIDLLNNAKDDDLDETLMLFIDRMVKGYFTMKMMEVAK